MSQIVVPYRVSSIDKLQIIAIGFCLVHIVDWLPTLVGLAGGRVDTETDGVDVWTALTTGQGHTRNTLGMSTFFPGNMKNFTNFTHLKEEIISF